MSDNTKPVSPATPANPAVAFTKEQLEIIQHMTVTAAMAVQNASQPKQQQPTVQHSLVPREECPECKQYVSACEHKHVKMAVFPVKYPEFMPFFNGVKINGVRYCSNNEADMVVVPACAESTIRNAINEFEQNEKTTTIRRAIDHNAGSLGRRGTGAVNATKAWR